MDLQKFMAQKAVGIKTEIKKVGPATVWISQPTWDAHTGEPLDAQVWQANLQTVDEEVAKLQTNVDALTDQIAALNELRTEIVAALK